MPAPKFSKDEREEVMLKVARLDARGRPTRDIAMEVGVSPQQVLAYLKRLRRTELELAVDEVKARRVKLLRELDEVKREAWDAWEKSKVRIDLDAEGRPTEVRANPDPRYLQTVRQAMEDERAMLGLDEPPAKGDGDGEVSAAELWANLANVMPAGAVADDVEAELAALNVVDSNDPPAAPTAKLNGVNRNGKH